MKKKRILISLIIILIIIGPILYFVYDKFIKSDEGANYSGKILRDIAISKVDKDKEYIYEADYEAEFKGESYTTDINETYYSKDLKVPYINIDSLDAISANKEIKKVFLKAVESYNTGFDDKATFVNLTYDSYENDKIISVIVKYDVRDNEISNPEYYTYNFDASTGELITFEDAYKIAKLDSDSVDKKIKEAIENEIRLQTGDNLNVYSKGTSLETYVNKTYNAYKEKSDIKFILNDDNDLSVVLAINTPGQLDNVNRLLELK